MQVLDGEEELNATPGPPRNRGLAAAALAALAALPGLGVPFVADDWINLWQVRAGVPLRTPFGYFRPLYLASFWTETRVWGLHPLPFHAANALLLAACAGLLVVVAQRWTQDARWAATAGVLFALHPYHVENAAWVAARGDIAATLLILLALLAFHRWTRSPRGVPYLCWIAFEAGLLFKETVVLFPAIVLLLELLRGSQPLSRRLWQRAILPLTGVALAHFLLLRPLFLEMGGFAPLRTLGISWLKVQGDFCTAAVLPLHMERIEAHPRVLAAAALLLVAALAALARVSLRRHLLPALGCMALFVCTCLPSLISFQERYFLLPSTVSSVVLAFLLTRIRRPGAVVSGGVLLAVWGLSLAAHWQGWLEAGKVSDDFVSALTRASRRPGLSELVVVNQPYRVRGVPVGGDLRAAILLSGGEGVDVRFGTALNLPSARVSGLMAIPARRGAGVVRAEVRLARGPFTGIFLPRFPGPGGTVVQPFGTIVFQDVESATVSIHSAPARDVYAWQGQRLHLLD